MSRPAPFNPRFRPQPVTTAEIDRSADAAERLLAEPADWLRRIQCARLDVLLDEPSPAMLPPEQRTVLHAAGFKALCTAMVRQPGPGRRIARRVVVWVDSTATVRAEVVGEQTRRIYVSTLFDDGSSVVTLPDATVAEWIRSPKCTVLAATGDLRSDLETHRESVRSRERAGLTALVCATGAAYRVHLRLVALHGSKRPTRLARLGGSLIYPMTPIVAADMVARRDAHADCGLSHDGS